MSAFNRATVQVSGRLRAVPEIIIRGGGRQFFSDSSIPRTRGKAQTPVMGLSHFEVQHGGRLKRKGR